MPDERSSARGGRRKTARYYSARDVFASRALRGPSDFFIMRYDCSPPVKAVHRDIVSARGLPTLRSDRMFYSRLGEEETRYFNSLGRAYVPSGYRIARMQERDRARPQHKISSYPLIKTVWSKVANYWPGGSSFLNFSGTARRKSRRPRVRAFNRRAPPFAKCIIRARGQVQSRNFIVRDDICYIVRPYSFSVL